MHETLKTIFSTSSIWSDWLITCLFYVGKFDINLICLHVNWLVLHILLHFYSDITILKLLSMCTSWMEIGTLKIGILLCACSINGSNFNIRIAHSQLTLISLQVLQSSTSYWVELIKRHIMMAAWMWMCLRGWNNGSCWHANWSLWRK